MSLSKLRPVARQSTESIVTDNLRDFILSGEARPGERLTEIALADQLGVARATLRTALHRLTVEGIVVQIPYTGWQVASLTPHDVWEIWTLRGSLESLASRLAAQRREPEIRAALETAFSALRTACEAGNLKEMIDADFALHQVIIDSSGHRRLAAQYRIVEQQVRLFIATSNTHVATGPGDIIAQHQPLIAALRAGDAEAAAAAAWEHDETEGLRLTAWLRGQGDTPAA
ncbi:GntR family transcriptional regulator [Paenirhodobacter populi]|uniref:GntR family transcriptional regulator n=1 Tax=Paenirhodobacter populi TaxID=2306993 RepID=A0A443ITH7_9RHOB|nr:GntR family transcriptional regulator [Sinirhodobacter populi]RWR11009.1 GntR family transcriptional regulator [Sinirhodobacter populi]RWR21084.1 GntR family transcriptional regulator [Sinirhodobacter populi]